MRKLLRSGELQEALAKAQTTSSALQVTVPRAE